MERRTMQARRAPCAAALAAAVATAVAALGASGTAAPLGAQGAPAVVAEPPEDTTALLAELDAAVRRDGRDAAAWHRRGMVAWTRVRPRMRVSFMKAKEDIALLRAADSSLRYAVAYAPDSARYLVDLGRYFLNANLITLRLQSYGLFERALVAARRANDSLLVAEAADELGMVHWRRYEAVADRQNVNVVQHLNLDRYAFGDGRELREALAGLTWNTGEWSGQADYFRAADLFAEAARHFPNHARAVRHSFMALAERGRWEELRQVAAQRLDAAPWDPQGWLALGLAAHRLSDERAAQAAFDSALVFLSPVDRDRYTRLSRILRPKTSDTTSMGDSVRFAAVAPEARAAMERVYWMLSDPLALTPENEHRLEFLARVAYAELRWTSDDFDLRGADTDRGDVWVRYGPPALVAGFPPENGVSSLLWLYSHGLAFVFRTPPTYGTATFAGDYAERARLERLRTPVRWDNLEIGRRIDSIAVQLARFRGAGDSTDVFLAADIPVDSLTAGLDVRRGALDVDLRVYGADARVVVRDSTRTSVEVGSREAPRTRAWRERLGPGTHVYRVEALQPDAMRGARALGAVRTGSGSGFAMSDVLVAARVLPRQGSSGEGGGARWSEFNIVPNVGTFHRGESVALLWETYALQAKNGGSRYRVAVTLERVRKRGAAAFAARVVGGAASAVGRNARGNGRVRLTYDRQAPAAPVAVEYLTLDLGQAPAGRYRLAVEVTDLVSVKRTVRESAITILE